MCWTPRVYKKQEKDKQRKTTPQYVLDTKGIQDTGERQTKENHTTLCVGHQGYTRHRRKTNKGKPHHNMCWTMRVYETQEKDTQENHTTICVGYQGYTRHRRKTTKGKPHHNMCWTPRVYKTQEKDKERKTTPQYVLDTKGIQDTGERQTKENHTTICVGHQGYTRHRTKTNKGKPHHNMCWTPLFANKHT
jgi:hypothetical protein